MNFNQDFSLVAGDTLVVRVPIRKVNGEAYDLTGCTIEWGLKAAWSGETPVLSLSNGVDGGISVVSPSTSGYIDISLTSEDTVEITPGTYFHGCVITDSLGAVHSAFVGTVVVYPKVI